MGIHNKYKIQIQSERADMTHLLIHGELTSFQGGSRYSSVEIANFVINR